MTCDFHYDRSSPFYELDPGCQFGKEKDFYKWGEKHYCQFHLPMEDADGHSGPKAGWDKARIKDFNDLIFAHIKEAQRDAVAADLTGVVFPGFINFGQFDRSSPLPAISFSYAVFSDLAGFINAAFSGYTHFGNAVFSSRVYFRGAAFSDFANFYNAAFSDLTVFNNAVFSGRTVFNNAVFSGHAYFDEAVFVGNANFYGGAGDGAAPSNIFRHIGFENTKFTKKADFTNRRFLDTTVFRNTFFGMAPEFHNAELHQDTDFTWAKFPDTESEHAVRAYRTLKLAMGNVRAREEEAMFYALEQESLRKRRDTSWSVKTASLIYKLTADYGRSFVRPLVGLLIVEFVFYYFYNGARIIAVDGTAGAAFDFTIRQMVQPFFVWTDTAAGLYWLKFLAGLQSILSFGLITLFILAVRRRFKLS